MNSRPSSEFAADPITTKPVSKSGPPEPVSPPFLGDSSVGSNLADSSGNSLLVSEGFVRDTLPANAFHVGLPPSIIAGTSPGSFHGHQDSFPGGCIDGLSGGGPGSNEWQQQQQQYQQLVSQQALLNQLQNKIQMGQGPASAQHAGQQQAPLASLLSQQLHAPNMQDHAFHAMDPHHQTAYSQPSVPIHWPRISPPRSPPSGFASSPSPPTIHSFPETQGFKHSHGLYDDRKHMRTNLHGSAHGVKGRPVDADAQGNTIEKLRREIARLQSEVDRLEKEVARQKSLRETERIEFTDAKDRVRHSWAVDRDDFARVKSLLKTKNAEHHAQSGRLSQQLKEAEAVNRGLKELCARNGISLPAELDVSQGRRHSISPGQRSSISVPSLPSSQISNSTLSEADTAMPSRTPSEMSFDSDFLERLAAARVSVRNPGSSMPQSGSQPPSPVSPAIAVLQMVQQLQQVVPPISDKTGGVKIAAKSLDFDDVAPEQMSNEAATHAAAQAAAALSHLAAALSSAKLPGFETACSSRCSSPHAHHAPANNDFGQHLDGQTEKLGQYTLTDTNLNRMSLQSWVKPSNRPSQSPSESSRSCSPRHAASETAIAERVSMVEAQSLPANEASQFSLNTPTSGCTSHEGEEIQMWPVSPNAQRTKSLPPLVTPSLAACANAGQAST